MPSSSVSIGAASEGVAAAKCTPGPTPTLSVNGSFSPLRAAFSRYVSRWRPASMLMFMRSRATTMKRWIEALRTPLSGSLAITTAASK